MQKRKVQHRKPRKKVRRKLHKGRLAFVLLILFAIIALPLWFFGAFDFEKTPKVETIPVEVEQSNESDTIVSMSEYAKRDAQIIMNAEPETYERHKAILQVKSREAELRLNGYNHAADEYINTIKQICK